MNHSPKITHDDVVLLEEILGETGDWMLARDIAAHPTWMAHYTRMSLENSKRILRAIANASNGSIVSAPSSQGYKLNIHCTAEEKERVVAQIRSQMWIMNTRANQIEQFGNTEKQGTLV